MEAPPSVLQTPGGGARIFAHLLANTLVANIATGFLWFVFAFWVYTETRNVLASGLISATYLLLGAIVAVPMGIVIDRFPTGRVLRVSALATVACFAAAGALLLSRDERDLLDFGRPWFWLFAGLVLLGAVCEQVRAIALSTLVTRLVPDESRPRANGLVGAAQGVTLLATSALSGVTVAFLGLGWAWALATAATLVTLVHLLAVRVPSADPGHHPAAQDHSFAGLRAFAAIPGLRSLLVFGMLNNLLAGVYVALMDPYGLTVLPVHWWGVASALASTGMIAGGLIVARFGLGTHPLRTMLGAVVLMGAVGAACALRESWPLFIAGVWAYTALMPVVEATEQTVIQRMVPAHLQGRAFGLAAMLEAGAAPIAAFLVAPLTELVVIPHLETPAGRQQWAWLLGDGEVRGIALVFVVTGVTAATIGALAFRARAYRTLSAAI